MKYQSAPLSRSALATRSFLATSVVIASLSLALPFITPRTQAQVAEEPATDLVEITSIPPRAGENGELSGAPGETMQTVIKVRNNSPESMTFHSIATDFIIGEDGETPIPVTDQVTQRWSLASWITLSPEFTELAPNQTGLVNVVINIPSDALPGGHYAMVTHQPSQTTAETDPATQIDDSAAVINQRVGTLLYVVVEGPINEEAFIRDLTFPKFTEFGPVPFAFAVDNQSDIHIRPKISVAITNLFGQTIETITLEEKNIFPLSSRNYQGMWDRLWGIGPYKATVTMSFGQNGQLATAHQSFWLFPITIFWVVIVVLLVLIVVFIAVKRHWSHRTSQDKARVAMLEERLAELEKERLTKIDQ